MTRIKNAELPPSHPTRQPWYQPDDPVWAPVEAVAQVRERLMATDPRLNVWWVHNWKKDDAKQPGRWAVVYFMQRARTWSVVYYWEGAGGEFRPLSIDCADAMVNAVRSREIEADKLAKQCEDDNEKRGAARKQELFDNLAAEARDVYARTVGVRQTFGPGYIRSRRAFGSSRNRETYLRKMRLRG